MASLAGSALSIQGHTQDHSRGAKRPSHERLSQTLVLINIKVVVLYAMHFALQLDRCTGGPIVSPALSLDAHHEYGEHEHMFLDCCFFFQCRHAQWPEKVVQWVQMADLKN